MLGKGLTHGARQVDAVVIPFERAARAARAAMPQDDDPVETVGAEEPADALFDQDPPLPATGTTETVSDEQLMRLAADVGLIRHVEPLVKLARRSVRLTPGDGPPADGARSRLGGAPDLPFGGVWPRWDEQPLTFLGQLDLGEAHALGLDPALPADGLVLIFSALERAPAGSSPLDRNATQLLYVEPSRIPRDPGARIGGSAPVTARALELSVELSLPRVWSADVQALGLDDAEQQLWEQVRRELAIVQGVEAWDAGEERRSRHHLLGWADESRGDMAVACELAARGVDVGYGSPRAHPEARRLGDAPERWRLLLQLSADEECGWSFGNGRDRLYLWGQADRLADGDFDAVHGLAR
jgi:uncharacterized protein YwqG